MAKIERARQIDDLADEFLAAGIMRMGFACENELHRTIRIIEDGFQALDIAHEKGRPFVGGEAARKANRQRVGVEDFIGTVDLVLWRAPALKLLRKRPRVKAIRRSRRRSCVRQSSVSGMLSTSCQTAGVPFFSRASAG